MWHVVLQPKWVHPNYSKKDDGLRLGRGQILLSNFCWVPKFLQLIMLYLVDVFNLSLHFLYIPWSLQLLYPQNPDICRAPHLMRVAFFLLWVASAYLSHVQRFQIWLKPRRHSSKKRCIRRQAINLASLEMVRVWWGRPSLAQGTLISAGIRVRQPRPTATKAKIHLTWSMY